MPDVFKWTPSESFVFGSSRRLAERPRRFRLSVALAGFALLMFSQSLLADTITFQLSPPTQAVTLGQTVSVDADISGIGAPGAQEVGSFDIFVQFDAALLSPAGITFGTELGDPNLFDALTASSFGAKFVEAAEVSLLSNADLDLLQPSTFTLATLSFTALSSGTASFVFLGGPIDNGDGDLIAGTKTVAPEPCSGLLVAVAFAALVWKARRRPATSVLALCAISTAGIGRAQPFTNGNFEQPGQKAIPQGQPFLTLNAGAKTIPGWQISAGDIDYMPASFWQPAGGQFSIDLNGFNTGSIFQAFDSKAGAKYQVSFCLAGDPNGGPNPKKMQVTAQTTDGKQSQGPTPYQFDASNTAAKNMGWVRKDLPFNGYDTTTQLTFASTIAGNFGPALDEVALQSPSEFKETPLAILVLKGVNIDNDVIADMVAEANKILKEQANTSLKIVYRERDLTNMTGDPPKQDGNLLQKNIAKFTAVLLQVVDEQVFKKGKGYTLLIANDITGAVGNANAIAFTPHSQTGDEPMTFLGYQSIQNAKLTAAQLGSTLAHEYAHYLTLAGAYTIDCGLSADTTGHHPSDKNNLMFPGSAARTGSMLTPHQKAEISRARSRLKGIAKTITNQSSVASLPSRTTSWTGNPGIVNLGYVNLDWGSVFIDFNNTVAELSIQFDGLFPLANVQTEYDFFVDTQNRSGTGQAPDVFSGADKIVRVRLNGVFPFDAISAYSADVLDVSSGTAVPLDSGFVDRLQNVADSEMAGQSIIADSVDVLLQRVPLALLGSLADQVPIGIRSVDVPTNTGDRVAFVFAYNPPPAPQVQMSPISGVTGDTIQLTGSLFPASTPVTITVDDTPATTANTGTDGSFAASFPFPAAAINCDVDGNGVVNILDINAILAARNTIENHFVTATTSTDLVRFDFSIFQRTVTANDARVCVLQCTKTNCAQ